MKRPPSFEGQAGRRNLLATLGSLTLLAFLTGKVTGKGRNRGLFAPKKKTIDCGPALTTATKGSEDGITGLPVTAKMLTEDGRLVEVDLRLANPVKNASDKEVRDWIKPINFNPRHE